MVRYCGRDFTPTEIELIRELLHVPQMNRARLSREVCDRLRWRRDNGGLKDMSCRVALNRMQADGLPELLAEIEKCTPRPSLDLEEVTLLDRDSVRFLMRCELEGIQLVNCPLYVREWITREGRK